MQKYTVKYDAFVSYKHGETDNAVAKAIQQNLEHLRVPRTVKSKKKRIERVFVDEGELSSSSHFSKTIREALKNSEWLIVLCSKETKNSEWVHLEIRTFLEFHDRDHILAVIIEGEPREIYPEELLANAFEDDEVLAADARGKTKREMLRKLKKDALYKLAAPILGITFDTLKQRRRAYVIQRLLIVTVVVLAMISGFLVYAVKKEKLISSQAQQLNREYEENFLNQARYMTNQAKNLMEQDKYVEAIKVLMGILPEQGEERPVLAESMQILSRCLNVYSNMNDLKNAMVPMGVIQQKQNGENWKEKIFLDEKQKYLFTFTEMGIQIWEIDTGELKKELNFPERIVSCTNRHLIPGTSQLIILTREKVCCYDYEADRFLWEENIDNQYEPAEEIADISLENRSVVYVTASETSGKYQIVEYNFHSRKYSVLPEEYDRIESLFWVKDKKLLIASGKGNVLIWKSGYTYQKEYDETALNIKLYDWEKGRVLWETQREHVVISDYDMYENVYEIIWPDENQMLNAFAYVYSDKCDIINKENGALLYQYEFERPVTNVFENENGLTVIIDNGYACSLIFGNKEWSADKYFTDHISTVSSAGEIYFAKVKQENTIIKYEYEAKNPNCEELYVKKPNPEEYISPKIREKQFTLYEYYDGDENERLILLDTEKGKEYEVQLSDNVISKGYEVLGFTKDYSGLLLASEVEYGKYKIIIIDTGTGGNIEIDLQRKGVWEEVKSLCFINHQLYYLANTADWNLAVCRFDDKEKMSELISEYEMETRDYSLVLNAFSVAQNGKNAGIIFYTYDDETLEMEELFLVVMDLEGKKNTTVSLTEYELNINDFNGVRKNQFIWNYAGDQVAFAFRDQVFVADAKGGIINRITCQNEEGFQIQFSPDDTYLFVVGWSGVLYGYIPESGELVQTLNVNDYTIGFLEPQWTAIDEKRIYLYDGSSKGMIINLDDTVSGVEAVISGGFFYDVEKNLIYIGYETYKMIRKNGDYFPKVESIRWEKMETYSVEELIEKGQDFIGERIE